MLYPNGQRHRPQPQRFSAARQQEAMAGTSQDPDCIMALTGHFMKSNYWSSLKHDSRVISIMVEICISNKIHIQQLLHTYLQCYTQALTQLRLPPLSPKSTVMSTG